jgi:hypothetical protein
MRGEDLMESGTLPALLEPRLEPVQEHPDDLVVRRS